MRASFVFSEVITGLRRNITMTIAMILTTAISLGLLGGGLLIVRLIDNTEKLYYDKVEVSVFLTNDVSASDLQCQQQICSGLRQSLDNNAIVEDVVYQNREDAYTRFKEIFSAQPELVKLTRPESLPASFRVKLKDPQRFDAISKEYTGKVGVLRVVDQDVLLNQLFEFFGSFRNATFAVALVQALAALLLISNTIQVSAFTRRTEVGIMRLVGATRWYTQLPFLIEAVVAGLTGAILALAGLFFAKGTFVDDVLKAPIEANIIAPLGYADVFQVSLLLFPIGAVISAITGYVTLRLYVRL
ncbi:permease-like cell division protein FtsX [Allokutzneria sp. A3M-2-11 16]|uniref:permease-like cell division protein FtsX n=1 Tax=Allokutzneria sp. A3M-2-11 16 TaxID=2962043 RepID=UPI0020B8B1BD|nr:permease-like cell division protein FtsX [Allokutzneria sp. A3M-2-11 16]MCP3798499.1 permease-like cell division protein FtsX [Allokutzneria sp. A3M-2-11 16]